MAGSIRHVLRCAELVLDDQRAWKWLALALHSALQGACVCHLTTTAAPVGAVTPRNAGEWRTYFEDLRMKPGLKPPSTRLMSLPDLLKAVRKPNSAGDRSNPRGIALSDTELAWLRRFHDTIRNQFTHFEPMGWSVEVSGMPGLARLCARIIGDVSEIGWAFRHKDRCWRASLERDRKELASSYW